MYQLINVFMIALAEYERKDGIELFSTSPSVA